MTGTVRTLAGSVRCDLPHYTGIDDFDQVNRTLSRRRILNADTAFLSSEPMSASSPHQSPSLEAHDGSPAEDISTDRSWQAGRVSDLPIDRDGDDHDESRSRLLLAMHEMRRRVERIAVADRSVRSAPKTMTSTTRGELIQELRELIAASNAARSSRLTICSMCSIA